MRPSRTPRCGFGWCRRQQPGGTHGSMNGRTRGRVQRQTARGGHVSIDRPAHAISKPVPARRAKTRTDGPASASSGRSSFFNAGALSVTVANCRCTRGAAGRRVSVSSRMGETPLAGVRVALDGVSVQFVLASRNDQGRFSLSGCRSLPLNFSGTRPRVRGRRTRLPGALWPISRSFVGQPGLTFSALESR